MIPILKILTRRQDEVKISFANSSTYHSTCKATISLTFECPKGMYTTTITATVLDLPRHEVILGHSWLRAVNPRMDWKRERMIIKANKRTLVFEPLTSNTRSRSCAPMSDQEKLTSDVSRSRGENSSQVKASRLSVECAIYDAENHVMRV